MSEEEERHDQAARAEKKYQELQEAYVDLIYEKDLLYKENQTLKNGKADDEARHFQNEIGIRDAEIETLKTALKGRDETIAIQKAKFDADQTELNTEMVTLKDEIEQLRLRNEELVKRLQQQQLCNLEEQVEVRVEAEVKLRINEEVNKRQELLHDAIKDMHRRMGAKDEEIRKLSEMLESTRNTPQNLQLVNSKNEEEIQRLKQALKNKEQQLEDLKIASAASTEMAGSRNNEVSEKSRSSSVSSPATENFTVWQEQVSTKLEEISKKITDQGSQPKFQNGHKGGRFPKNRYYNKHPAGASKKDTKITNEVPKIQSKTLELKFENTTKHSDRSGISAKAAPPVKPQTISAASSSRVLNTSTNIEDTGITKEGGNLLHIIQEASKFQSPKPPGKVTSTTTIDKRVPACGTQQQPNNGRGGHSKMQRSKSFTANPQPKMDNFAKQVDSRRVGTGKQTQPPPSIPRNLTKVPLEGRGKTFNPQQHNSKGLNETSIQPPLNDVLVLTTATRRLNIINPPSPVIPRKFQRAALGEKSAAAVPIQQIYHGSSKLRIDGIEYPVCFVLTLLMKTANNWVVNHLQVCFPKLSKGSPLASYGNCFMCLKFLDLIDEVRNPPRFVKTYEFQAQDGTCDSKDLFHLNCQKPTFVVEESNNFFIPVMRANGSSEYPPPPIEIDVFLMTREKHPTNADTIESKRKTLIQEFRKRPHDKCPQIKFTFNDGLPEELGADPCLLGPYTPIFYALWQQSICEGNSLHVSITKSNRNTTKAFLRFCNGEKLPSEEAELLQLIEFALSYFVPDLGQLCYETCIKLKG